LEDQILESEFQFDEFSRAEFKKRLRLEYLELETELEFRFRWGSQKSESKIGIPIKSITEIMHMHKCIASGPTGNWQGSIKFYCLTTGPTLKQCSFTPMQTPDRVIKQANSIGQQEKHGHQSFFLDKMKHL
jgi:hypothetical protein